MFIYTSPSIGGATLQLLIKTMVVLLLSHTLTLQLHFTRRIEGLTLGAAISNNTVGTANDSDETTMYATYAVGALQLVFKHLTEMNYNWYLTKSHCLRYYLCCK